MSRNGDLPKGYRVELKESGKKVLYSPETVPVHSVLVGGMVDGKEPRSVISWSEAVRKEKIRELAALDAIARGDERASFRRKALKAFAGLLS